MSGSYVNRWMGIALSMLCAGCSSPAEQQSAPNPVGMNPGGMQNTAGMQSPGAGGTGGGATTAGSGGSAAPGNTAGSPGTGAMAGTGGGGAAIPPDVMEMLDPNVDWTQLTLVYPTMYSAFDGEHEFKVPVYVDGMTLELSDWSAIPSSAVTIDPDPESGGVMISIVEPVELITIAARVGDIGGTAPIHVTIATPEQWAAGEARYNNGVDYELPMLDFAQLIDPNWMPPEPPDNLACNNCHTTGAKYFEIQHTPTQIARISDDDLIAILTTGTKPPGIGYRVLPEMFQHLYPKFHTWQASEDELVGLVVYLRSLTPTGQGDILLPDGSFGAPP